jgi:hypothetical protein
MSSGLCLLAYVFWLMSSGLCLLAHVFLANEFDQPVDRGVGAGGLCEPLRLAFSPCQTCPMGSNLQGASVPLKCAG